MRLLWVCNSLIPEIADKINYPKGKPESWLMGIYEELKQREDIHLTYLYPANSDKGIFEYGNTTFISFVRKSAECVHDNLINQFAQILKRQEPDVIHVFGTEFSHTCAMVEAAERMGFLDKVVISIQGLVSIYSRHYTGYLPYDVTVKRTFRDWIKWDNIKKQKEVYQKRGYAEERALRKVKHVIGRTDWDRACVERLNPDVIYHHCNENLRNEFYRNKWDYDKCEKHSIFLSQWYSPLKGLHLVLEAMAELVKRYPDIHLYTTGDFNLDKSFWNRIRYSQYKKYCAKLIEDNHLENHITFLGYLDEKAMCDRFLKSNVFVCASSAENSPNSVGEAMILGVPTISSDIGGVKNMLTHGKDGFIYQADAPYMLAYYIRWFFENPDQLAAFSESASQHAMATHDRSENMRVLFDIYREIELGATSVKG